MQRVTRACFLLFRTLLFQNGAERAGWVAQERNKYRQQKGTGTVSAETPSPTAFTIGAHSITITFLPISLSFAYKTTFGNQFVNSVGSNLHTVCPAAVLTKDGYVGPLSDQANLCDDDNHSVFRTMNEKIGNFNLHLQGPCDY